MGMEMIEIKIPRALLEKAGDYIYYVDYDGDVVFECIACQFWIDCDGIALVAIAYDEDVFEFRKPDPDHDVSPEDWCCSRKDVPIEEFGKTLFLTREEAEAALERMDE